MTIFCSSLRRSDTGWLQVFILSLTQSDKSSSRGRISVKFIISRQLPFVFRRRVLSSNLLYGKISPDSSGVITMINLLMPIYTIRIFVFAFFTSYVIVIFVASRVILDVMIVFLSFKRKKFEYKKTSTKKS